jgi:uncharacterized protein YbdZ (MbtH family)
VVSADDDVIYEVVVNHEEQYSIWATDSDPPDGWRREGTTGSMQVCLDQIDEVWTDMRPLSLRRFMAERQRELTDRDLQPGGASAVVEAEGPRVPDGETEPLPVRLTRGDWPIEVVLRPAASLTALREAIEEKYLSVRFTQTRGGTELGIPIAEELSDLSGADFDAGTGSVRLVGDLTLDFTPIRCYADIDLATLDGRGRVEVLAGP